MILTSSSDCSTVAATWTSSAPHKQQKEGRRSIIHIISVFHSSSPMPRTNRPGCRLLSVARLASWGNSRPGDGFVQHGGALEPWGVMTPWEVMRLPANSGGCVVDRRVPERSCLYMGRPLFSTCSFLRLLSHNQNLGTIFAVAMLEFAL